MLHRTMLPPVVLGLLPCLTTLPAWGDDAATLTESIDRQIDARLETEKLRRVAPADDAEFLRRVYLDLHGVVPSAERAARFLDSRDRDKRAQLIDELLASPRFGEHFGNLWRGRLISPLVNEQRLQSERFTDWLATRFNDNDGWDRIVYDLLTATGKLDENPAVTYLIEGRNPLGVTDLTDLTSHYFLGIRLNCAQCHDHPFAEWKQEDYWGMAAFFSQIQTPGRPKMVYVAGVQDNSKMTLSSLMGGDMLEGFRERPPTLLGGIELETASHETYRVALARWMTSSENPYFARAAVNRMWWHFFGRGVVNPVDDMHSGNPPSHPELLETLSQRFVESGFDLQFLCRAILNSRTYQQTSRPGDDADAEAKQFARVSIKVLSAEQLYDSLVAILGPPGKASGIDTRLGARYEFTQFFAGAGDPDPTRYERGIPHVLRLMNSPQFASRNVSALVSRVATASRPADEVVDELFLTILSRRATPAEQELAKEHVRDADESAQTAYRELAWTLLMSSEFSMNR
ncbi:MAG: DUF1553 domain-containing protein [Planctomycetia bacterium]|nr:DUF1553 domain-containing protein [Planctomycetia bacterium]